MYDNIWYSYYIYQSPVFSIEIQIMQNFHDRFSFIFETVTIQQFVFIAWF